MRILLTTLNSKYIHTNLAIRLLYQLNRHHAGLQWKEYTIKMAKDDVAEECAQFDIVCFSCYIWNITQTLAVAEKIKAKNPFAKILLGGPEVSYEWKEIIALPYIDYIIAGEGEIPFAEFLNNFPAVENIGNIVSKKDGNVLYFPQAVEFDLKNYGDIIPYAYDNKEELATKVLYIETSRGCPYKCEFCLASLDNKVRYLPNESIKQNLLFMMEHGKVIKFLDRTFNVKKDFTIDIFSFILKHHNPRNIFQFEITADIVHQDIIKYIDDNVPPGLFRFEIGIQTVNQQANLQVSRKQNFDKTKGIIQQLQTKIEMHLDLIVGLPLDYWNDIKYSIEEVFKLFAPELQLGFLKFLKGTPVRHKAAQHDFVYDPLPPYQIIESKYLSREQLSQIVILENALEIYWNKNRTQHTLKYVTKQYSIFDFLLGLGNYFLSRRNFHEYQLTEVYHIIFDFIKINYADDVVLPQLVAIDYYLNSKVKPKILFCNELERTARQNIIDSHQLNHHKYRFVIFPITFDYHLLKSENMIRPSKQNIIIQYDGKNYASIVEVESVVVVN